MVKLEEELWKTLHDLKEDEFEKFKWFLKQDDILDGLSGIPVSQLEKAKRHDTVDLMIQKYPGPGALKVTLKILGNIDRNDLVQRLRNLRLEPRHGAKKEEYKGVKPKLQWVQQFAVNVTLDPDTAHPHLIMSTDGKQVRHGDVRKKLPNNPERFYRCVNVLGKQSFSSGKFYYEVQVKGKTAWTVGVAKESIERKENIILSPKGGFWTLWLRDGNRYEANDNPSVRLSLKSHPQKVGVFVDYDEGLVFFYDVDAADLLYFFTGCSFTEKLYPFFSPCTNNGGVNSASLIISSVNDPPGLKTHDISDQKEDCQRKKAELKRIQQFAVDVTLDPETAHPTLILSDDGKQVHDGDVWKKLPDSPNRFKRCVNVLGKQSFSSGKFYYEVQVKGKTAWALGVAKESIKRKVQITANPQNGYWTIMLTNEDDYEANDDDPVQLSLNNPPQKVGVFVDYDEGLVCFYDVNSADLLYSFTSCAFTEKLYPFFTPFTNDGGVNSAPLIISPVNNPLSRKTHDCDGQTEEHEKKKAELKSVQQFAVDVTLDPDTAHPALILSDDRKQVNCGDVFKKLPYNPKRFMKCVNVLGKQSFSSGKFYYEVQVKGKTAWTVGVAKESIERKENIILSPEGGFWTLWLRDGNRYEAIDNPSVRLSLKSHPQKVGVFVDVEEGLVFFYDVDAADLIYSFTSCSFTEKLYPYFSPCTNDNGTNSAPLIISSVNDPPGLKTHDISDQKEDCERKKAELKRIQQFAVKVTLDPDTAHPALILSDDRQQVNCGDVFKKIPYNPKRFMKCVNVLGKQSFSSGKFYYEVQVKGKTEWDLGVAKESTERKENVILSPKGGFWTLWLRDGNRYKANDNPSVGLSLNHHPQKVGVFVDYDEGLVSFYDVDSADLIYSFTGCSFTEKLYPFFSPCTDDGGVNSAPLIISPVNHPLSRKTHDCDGQTEEHERKKAELESVQQFAVDVTLDPDTAHPALFLSEDGKQVHDGDVWKKLPDSPKRFKRCVNVLGKQSFSSGKFYYEVQVKGKTAWTIGVAKESIERKGRITLNPKYGFWTIHLENEDDYQAVDDPFVHLSLKSHPQKVGVFVDVEEGLVCFYDADSADLIYSFTGCSFTEKLYPFFSPCTNDGGVNSAPLIISSVDHPLSLTTHDVSVQKEDCERKKAELKRIQQFAVDVTLDPETAHPHLVLSDDGKQVHHSDVKKTVPNNPERFYRCVNVLGKQSFSSGRFYYEIQVEGKTAWALGVAKQSIKRKIQITACPQNGYWTIMLRDGDYKANDNPSVCLSLNHHPQKVGVFVDYDEGLISFYDVDAADLIYSFTDCSFTEKLYPFFSPFTNDGGVNSAPLIISPVNEPLSLNTCDFDGDKGEHEKKKTELKSMEELAVEVTLDQDTTRSSLILSGDGKQVHDDDVREKLPSNFVTIFCCKCCFSSTEK